MSNDLISKNKVLKILHDFGNRFELFSEDADAFLELFIQIRDMDSYNIDKIIQELKDSSKIYCKEYNQRDGNLYLLDAIEIVKQSDISDDVCEWKYVDSYPYYKVGCRKYRVPIQRGDHCSYCGKKIKVV